MFIKTTDELQRESALVPTTGVVKSSRSFEDTIKPSDEFLLFFKISYMCFKDPDIFLEGIKTLYIKMDRLFHKVINSQDTKFEDVITLAYIYQHICLVYVKSGQPEKLPAAKDSILRCLYLIKDKEADPKIILLTLKAYSHLSYIYHKEQYMMDAIKVLDKAIALYLMYMEEHSEYDIPIDYEDIIIKPFKQINGYSKLKSLYEYILEKSIDINIYRDAFYKNQYT
ncbi:uncharacterized protein LOC116840391 [Odontomachus brunneus]|uniref:uncharacterized protein LOC116840391 n=1 Tax=Odontomachus brunneus TaxID=486640 RepID=UPI0013F23409|nr:uncharacterized protein LOC116840391 [Odontomachus brunneus]